MDGDRPEYVCPLCDARSLVRPAGRTGTARAVTLLEAAREALRDDDREAITLVDDLLAWLEIRERHAGPELPGLEDGDGGLFVGMGA